MANEVTRSPTEIWKPVCGYEDLYEVSNHGRVRMIGRKKRHRTGVYSDVRPKFLNQFVVCGYSKVKLRDKYGKVKMVSVHRIVALAFIPNTDNLPQVNHKDENKLNNNSDNLEFCSAKYNSNYGNGKLKCSVKRMKPVIQMSLNGEVIDTWPGISFAAKALNLSQSSISRCCNGDRITQTGGYKWKFLINK